MLDATVAGATADSYLSVVEADAYAANDPVTGDAWLAATLGEKERLLVAATADVDLFKKSVGVRYSSGQALLYPRAIDFLGDPMVPFLHPAVKRATYEQATYLRGNARLIADSASRRAQGLLNAGDGDGSWTAAMSPTYGLYAPKMVERLESIGAAGRAGRFIYSVPIGSSFT